jgi:hypothetical protein
LFIASLLLFLGVPAESTPFAEEVPPPGTPTTDKAVLAYVYDLTPKTITLEIPNQVTPASKIPPGMENLFTLEKFKGKFGSLDPFPTVQGTHRVVLPAGLKKGDWVEAVIGSKTIIGNDGISMPTMMRVGFLSSLKKTSKSLPMPHFVIGEQDNMNNRIDVYSDGTIMGADDSHQFIGHLSPSRLASLTAICKPDLLSNTPEELTLQQSNSDWQKLHSLAVGTKARRLDPNRSGGCKKIFDLLAQIRGELLEKGHRTVTFRSSYEISGQTCHALQGSYECELSKFKDIKDFPNSIPFQLVDMYHTGESQPNGVTASIPDDIYQNNKAFWDSITEKDIYRQGNFLYTLMSVHYGIDPLPPIELK